MARPVLMQLRSQVRTAGARDQGEEGARQSCQTKSQRERARSTGGGALFAMLAIGPC